MSDFNDLKKWHNNAPPLIKNNTEVMKVTEPLYHISHDVSIKRFIPRIGDRQAPSEDRTVPRITCAPTILGCMIGHSSSESQFLQYKDPKEKKTKYGAPFRGGWKIYEFNPEAFLLPTSKLVYDQKASGEVWLTTYNANTHAYAGKIVGTMFYESISHHARKEKDPVSKGVLYVEVEKDFPFSGNRTLEKGHYRISGYTQRFVKDFRDDKSYQIDKIDEKEYVEAKHGVASMLSFHEQPLPVFFDWKN